MLKLPTRRTVLKVIHWTMVPLLIWFVIMQPSDVVPLGLFQFHSVLALIFVSITLFWTEMHLRKGLASRPGPKLPPWARKLHQVMHKTIVWGLFCVAVTGFLLGLSSAVLLKAGIPDGTRRVSCQGVLWAGWSTLGTIRRASSGSNCVSR